MKILGFDVNLGSHVCGRSVGAVRQVDPPWSWKLPEMQQMRAAEVGLRFVDAAPLGRAAANQAAQSLGSV